MDWTRTRLAAAGADVGGGRAGETAGLAGGPGGAVGVGVTELLLIAGTRGLARGTLWEADTADLSAVAILGAIALCWRLEEAALGGALLTGQAGAADLVGEVAGRLAALDQALAR